MPSKEIFYIPANMGKLMDRKHYGLSEEQISAAKPEDKIYRLYDGDGLYLHVTPTGGKWWRCKYHPRGEGILPP
jgi:hypothetical protein